MYNGKLTQTEVLELGFTKSMIDKLLPDPELRKNNMYRGGYPIKLWKEDDVLSVMETDTYIELKAKADKRRASCAKATETKANKLRIECEKKIELISVKRIDTDLLVNKTLAAKQNWYRQQSSIRGEIWCERNAYQADQDTVDRWCVNYIRHKLTRYDKDLYSMKGKVGCHDAYADYKAAVLDKIAETYPEYADECEMQKIQYSEYE